ncbi:winged helix DNA-binding protein [Flavobacteriaceae bacterium Ap0902]|nr:winged helix DNA-binding protein [Flavobacteriaceae bacterium Ap0902]
MNYDLLHSIINSLEAFEEDSTGNVDLDDYRRWLNEKAYLKESPKKLAKKFNLEVNELENEICKQVILLSRYAKSTIKKGLEDYPELVNEDFTYLYRLMDYDSLTKMQLIDKNGQEKQTGLEIIKRLIKHGLIDEFQDPDDGRSRRLTVTKKGKKVFKESMKEVTLTSKVLGGNLTVKEKETLLNLLIKLNHFHEVVYTKHKDSTIQEIENLLKA